MEAVVPGRTSSCQRTCAPEHAGRRHAVGGKAVCREYEGARYRWIDVNDEQQPLELILARNLLSSISTPGFLVDKDNGLVFYNEAAGALLGKRFEAIGKLPFEQWSVMFGPLDDEGEPLPAEALPLVIALREGRPSHSRLHVQSLAGERHEIEVAALPLVANAGGFRGALAIFWPIHVESAA
jgi:PAS domain-containing protein